MNPCRGLAACRPARASRTPGAVCRRAVLRVLGPALVLAVTRPWAAAPGSPAPMRLAARVAGRFAVETHRAEGRHAALLYLEVQPR